jgi:pentapeptide MXKDX repeat protein
VEYDGSIIHANFSPESPLAYLAVSNAGEVATVNMEGTFLAQYALHKAKLPAQVSHNDKITSTNGMGWDGMGWDGMGWDGMGWDGMGWDGMGWDGMDVMSCHVMSCHVMSM